jgi:hypothetical protein
MATGITHFALTAMAGHAGPGCFIVPGMGHIGIAEVLVEQSRCPGSHVGSQAPASFFALFAVDSEP